MRGYKDLIVFQKSFELAMEIFELSKLFPKEEKYSLVDQIRRSSRSVCVNIGEGYRKRKYPAHFVSKLTDADMENTETEIWIEFARSCQYLADEPHQKLLNKVNEVGKILGYMIQHPGKFL